MKNRFLFALLVVVFGLNVNAQNRTFKSPREVIEHHLHYLQEENYYPTIAAEAIPKVESAKNRSRLAIQLIQILDGNGLYVELEDVPNDSNYIDSATKKSIYRLFPLFSKKLYVEKIEGGWIYSETTAKMIPEWHRKSFPFGLNKLLNIVPDSWHSELLGLEIGQIAGILLIILIALACHKLFTWLIRTVFLRILLRFNNNYIASGLLKKVARPLSWFLIVKLVAIMVPALLLPALMAKYILMILNAASPILGMVVFYRLIDVLTEFFSNLASKTESTMDDQLIPLVNRVLKITVLVIGSAFVLYGFGFDPRAYLAGISIGGIAIALAAQDTVKNLFGSAMIFIDKPFKIGDWINYEGVDGTVEEVGFRSTRVRTFYNSVVSIPNGKFTDSKVDNYGLRIYRRYSTKLTVTYDTPPEKIEVFVKGLRELVKKHPNTRKDYFEIHLNDLGATSLEILFYIFFKVPEWGDELKARHEMLISILKLAEKLEVRFAFPTQTLHIEEVPGAPSLTPKHNLETLENQLQSFLKNQQSN